MLVDFKRGTRPMAPMTPLVAPLSDQDMRDLAAFYAQAGRRPVPATPVDRSMDSNLKARGEQLYREEMRRFRGRYDGSVDITESNWKRRF